MQGTWRVSFVNRYGLCVSKRLRCRRVSERCVPSCDAMVAMFAGGRLSSGTRPNRIASLESVEPIIDAPARVCRTNGQVADKSGGGTTCVSLKILDAASAAASAQRERR